LNLVHLGLGDGNYIWIEIGYVIYFFLLKMGLMMMELLIE